MQDLTTSSVLALFDTDKSQREYFIDNTVRTITEGKLDPLKAHLQLKAMESIIDGIKSSKEYKECLLDLSSKYGKSFELHNGKFEIKEMGTKYDYSNCEDSELMQLESELIVLQAKIKERQKFLRGLPSDGLSIVDDNTGEVSTIYPPIKTSTTTVVVTLK